MHVSSGLVPPPELGGEEAMHVASQQLGLRLFSFFLAAQRKEREAHRQSQHQTEIEKQPFLLAGLFSACR